MRKLLLCIIFISSFTFVSAQKLPIIHAENDIIDIRDGENFIKGKWKADPQIKPDIYDVEVYSSSKLVTFITDKDSISFKVKAGKTYPFIILVNKKDSAFTTLKGIKTVPAAIFNNEYIKQHNRKTFVEIPQVYELVNIVIALTATAKKDNNLVIKNTLYYKDLLKWFNAYNQERVVLNIDSALKSNFGNYYNLKMDAYSFELSTSGKIRQSKIYDRINWGKENNLRPFIKELQKFADKSNFKQFYKKHQAFYNKQIVSYRDTIGLQEMQSWLNKNFSSTKYNSFKIIFSPLVGYNQSAVWFENNGFKEAQAHVNFPYRDVNELKLFSKEALAVRDGNIVFTELNHSFINPESENSRYSKSLQNAFSNLDTWIEKDKPASNYNDVYSCFNEHMNWGLVALRYIDYAPADEQSKLIDTMEKRLVSFRGFKKFAEFNQALIKLYKSRKNGQTVADLYPQIIKWFEDNK